MAVTRKQIAEYLAGNSAISKKSAEEIVKDLFDFIVDSVKNGEVVQIADFGTFKKKERPERQVRNPATGEMMTSPAKSVVVFKPFPATAAKINGAE